MDKERGEYELWENLNFVFFFFFFFFFLSIDVGFRVMGSEGTPEVWNYIQSSPIKGNGILPTLCGYNNWYQCMS